MRATSFSGRVTLEIEPSFADTFNHIPKRVRSERIDHTQFPVTAQYAERQDNQDLKQLGITDE